MGGSAFVCGQGGHRDHGAARIAKHRGEASVAGGARGPERCRPAFHELRGDLFHILHAEVTKPVRLCAARERLLVQGPDNGAVVTENLRVKGARRVRVRRTEFEATELRHARPR